LFQLIAEGPEQQRWKIALTPGQPYELGRDPEADLPVPWDRHISRRHARVTLTTDHVVIEKLATAGNPIFFAGSAVDTCEVRTLQNFVVGSTCFQVVDTQVEFSSPETQPVEEVTFDRQELRKVRFRDADKRIEVLSHLPEVIWGARTDTEFHHQLLNLVLAGVVNAEAAAVVRLDEQETLHVPQWDRRRETAGPFRPSSRLVTEAIRTRRRSVLHIWETSERSTTDYTQIAEFDWAFCTPVGESSGSPWGLYVAGRLDHSLGVGGSPSHDGIHLQADVKFTEIVAEIVHSVQRLSKLERHQSGLRQFFAPPILEALGNDLDTDLLEPRECDVSILFCDLRGFSQTAEESADDLIGLLDRVSRALGVMTQHILEHGGVTGDFQGDAALAFWGWPFASDEAPLNACRAALGIRNAFAETRRRKDHPLANFEMGIGIAHGKAVAGKIGTSEQVKVTVFGPVVNLAKRLESMTKQLRVPIVLDEQTAQHVSRHLDRSEGRLRRLAKVLPYGMETPVLVSELLPPESDSPDLTDGHLQQYERAVDHFLEGRWEEAYRSLHDMPASDLAQDFLGMMIAQHSRVAPPDWDGVIRLPTK
jgi:adenylate cyclase